MKRVPFIIGCLILFQLGCQKNVIYDLEMINTEKYINQPVYRLLDDIGRPYKDYQFIDEPLGRIIGCAFVYDKDQHLIIYLTRDLLYLEEFKTDMTWDINIFKKEKIGAIYVEKLISGRKPLSRPISEVHRGAQD